MLGGERIGHAAAIACDGVSRPPAVALNVGQTACDGYFVSQFVGVARVGVGSFHGGFHRLAYVHVSAVGVIVPPSVECSRRGSFVVEFPVELRHHIVHPSLFGPFEHIGIECIVVLQSIGFAAAWVGTLVAPHAEGADAQAHPWFFLRNHIVQALDEQVHVLATPIAAVHAVAVGGIAFVVGELIFGGIGVEIVVHVNCVDIIARDDVAHHGADEFAALRQSRVEVGLPAILHKPFGVFVIDVPGCEFFHFALGVGHAIGVEPSVEFHAAVVTFGNHKLQRIPIGIGRLAKFAGEIHAPRLEIRGIESIGFGAHLP